MKCVMELFKMDYHIERPLPFKFKVSIVWTWGHIWWHTVHSLIRPDRDEEAAGRQSLHPGLPSPHLATEIPGDAKGCGTGGLRRWGAMSMPTC